jgi:hypothetical protein
MENLDSDATWLALEYIRGNLTNAEMDAVEARMAADRDFYQLVHDLRQMQNAESETHEPEHLTLAQAAADAHFNTQPPKRKIRWGWAIAAVSTAAILIFTVAMFANRGPSYIRDYFDPDEEIRLLGSQSVETFEEGMDRYQEGDYEGAASLWKSIPDTVAEYNTVSYYLANAYLAEGQLQPALDQLLILEKMNDQKYQDVRRWMLGLIYLDQGEKEKGEKELLALRNSGSDFKGSQVNEILASLSVDTRR